MNRKEYNTAVKDYSGRLFRYVVKCLRSSEDANDIVQEAYEKLWTNRKKVPLTKAKSWLFTTAHNMIINHTRKRKALLMEDQKCIEPSVNEHSYELRDLITQALESLPDVQRQIILLRDLEGYNYKEIGEILQLNESQVKVYLFRGRQKIRHKLKDISVLVA
ncbi:MAG: RNA polymerase sigma factor [Crocinitomicaceae bacterium]|jgi:RNA polymerase sigma-70 factor (ECF subfamily)|nr:RNA polymerase sigma factor [Crocinitomicaceae bacterium]MBT6513519.1 RNA polymerase sigma factor [Crocinitomicaceae bacterium]